jgi:hypothetical protein
MTALYHNRDFRAFFGGRLFRDWVAALGERFEVRNKGRKIYLVRRFLYGSVEPYFGEAYFCSASLAQIARHLAASRTAGCAGRNAGADDGASGENVAAYLALHATRARW